MDWTMLKMGKINRRCSQCNRFIRNMTIYTGGKCAVCRRGDNGRKNKKTMARKRAVKAIAKTVIALLVMVNVGIAGEVRYGTASWYSIEACRGKTECFTADGSNLRDLERAGELFAASWDYGFGTNLKVTSLATGRSVEVTVRDRGPSRRLGRIIDLGRDAFEEIADLKDGLVRVSVEVIA